MYGAPSGYGLVWKRMEIVDSVQPSNTRVYVPPYALPFSQQWSVWPQRWFNYRVGTLEVYSQTVFGTLTPGCTAASIVVFRH
jgi:hypothetical protein